MKPVTRAVLGIALAVLAGCSSQQDGPEALRSDIIRGQLRQEIVQDRPEVAIGRISGLRSEEVLSDGELDLIQHEAQQKILANLEQALTDGAVSDAIRLHRNMQVLRIDPVPGPTLSELYLELAREYRDSGNGPAAIATLLRAPELSSLPVSSLEALARGAVSLNNRYAVEVAAHLLGDSWLEENPDVSDFLAGSVSPIDALLSSVTIWVNRGIRLENGIGYPDRVIGSGFFIDPRGYIITNHHVIESEVDPEYEGYSRLYIRLPEDPDERIPARVVGYDRIFDIALLKVELDAPGVLSFTDIRSLEPGKAIIAVGSPGGLESTITSGIISATGRRFLQLGDAMQVDVPINPGNSGGPLLDQSGNLIGVVFAGIEQYEGINFAIPSYWIGHFLPRLYDEGEVVHPWIGVSVVPVSDGLEVTYVVRNSPAVSAGLEVGDVITGIGPWDVSQIGSAQRAVLGEFPGSLIEVSWLRDGEPVSRLVALEARPFSPVEQALETDVPERLYPVLYGMAVTRLGEFSFSRRYTVNKVYRGSIADETGISAGDSFVERDFEIEEDFDVALLRIVVKKRTEGFMQTGIQLPAYLLTDTFL